MPGLRVSGSGDRSWMFTLSSGTQVKTVESPPFSQFLERSRNSLTQFPSRLTLDPSGSVPMAKIKSEDYSGAHSSPPPCYVDGILGSSLVAAQAWGVGASVGTV